MDNQKIGSYIAACRKQKNLTQQQLADALGITNKAVSKWERGHGLPDIGLMPALANSLGVSVDSILRGEAAAPQETACPPTEKKSATTSFGQMLRAKIKVRKPSRRTVLASFALAAALGISAVQIAFHILAGRYNLIYLLGPYMSVALNCAILLFFFLGFFLLLQTRWKAKIVLSVVSVLLLLSSLFSKFSTIPSYDHTLSLSPDKRNVLILQTDPVNGQTHLYKQMALLFARESSPFPYTVWGDVKIQWLANDVCAVTYRSSDEKVHQYVATYGTREGFIGYSVPAALNSTWVMTGKNPSGWGFEQDTTGFTVRNAYWEEHYSYSDCVQFGTLAIALCRDGLPQWTVALNDDCTFDANGIAKYGSTLSLCEVSMQKTATVTFTSVVNRPPAQPDPEEPTRRGTQLRDEMLDLLHRSPDLSDYTSLPGAIRFTSTSTDLFEIGRALYENSLQPPQDTTIATQYQIDTIRILAGDRTDFLIQFNSTFTATDKTTGESETTGLEEKYRVMQGDGAYLARWVSRDIDGAVGLLPPDLETVLDTCGDPYYYFSFA